jgi:cytochrome c-type biogenesis protein CcmF
MQGARELIARSRVKAEPGQQRMSMLAFVGVNKDRYGAYIMHLALAIFLIGIVGSSLLDARQDIVLKPGESVTVKNYTLTYEGLEFQGGVDKMNFVANVAVASKGKDLGTLKPAKASYTGYEQQYTEVAIRSTPAEDIYVILGTSDTDLLANVHDSKSPQAFSILVNPLVMWVWIGGMLLLAGGVICFWPRRELAPAVVQARQPTVPAPPTPPASPGKPMPQAQPARQAQTQQRQARPLSRRAQRRRAR